MKTLVISFVFLAALLQVPFEALYSQSRTTSLPRQISATKATVRLEAIDITANRVLSSSERLAAPATVLSAATIQSLGARQIADALAFVPGVFVRNYGGLGGLKTLSLRGASASQTAVLLDGVRVQSTQSGQFDFSTFPASMVEELEVLRGGGAAVFGGSAMAGAVNIRTKSHIQQAELRAEAEAASFQEFRGNLTGALPLDIFGTGKGGLSAGAEVQTAQGNYPFVFNDFGQNLLKERSNADIRQVSAHALLSSQSNRFSLQTRAFVRSSERGTPGAVVQGNIEMARARLGEDDVLLSVKAAYIPAEQVLFTILASGKFNTLHYRDPDARQFGLGGINERFFAQDFSLNGRLRFDETTNSPLVTVSHEWTFEHNRSTLQGNMLQPGVGTFVERINTGIAGKGDIRWKFSDNERTGALASNIAVRFDHFSDIGVAIAPLLGSAWILDSAWTLRGEWSWNFRPPAFNELYYLNFGNSRLQPERAQCWNVGVSWQGEQTIFGEVLFGRLRLKASIDGFFHRTQNQILAVQTTPFTISAQNIAEAQSYGVESRFHADLEQYLSLTLNYTYQRSTNETPTSFSRGKQLIYTPEHLASALAVWKHDISSLLRLHTGFSAQLVGGRFYLPSNSPESLLPAFAVVTAFCETTFILPQTQVSVRLQADNLFDEGYAVIRNFPMPGRALRLSTKAIFR